MIFIWYIAITIPIWPHCWKSHIGSEKSFVSSDIIWSSADPDLQPHVASLDHTVCLDTAVHSLSRHHEMEPLPALLTLCEGNHGSPMDSPHKGPVMRVWWFVWCFPEQTVERTLELPIIWNTPWLHFICPFHENHDSDDFFANIYRHVNTVNKMLRMKLLHE